MVRENTCGKRVGPDDAVLNDRMRRGNLLPLISGTVQNVLELESIVTGGASVAYIDR